MKRRVISLLAILAMLCSMVVFAMPTTVVAASVDDGPLASIMDDIALGATELGKLSANADEEAIIKAAKLDKDNIEWKDFEWNVNDFPRYAYHKIYEAAGYPLDQWSISKQEDWEAMREVADSVNGTRENKGEDAKKDPETGEYQDYFIGTVFHLTNDIQFSYPNFTYLAESTGAKDPYTGAEVRSMGFSAYNNGGGFAGTINGHGYSFKDIKVIALKKWIQKKDASGAYVNEFYENEELYCGLFHRLSNCTFIDFGLEGGAFYQNTGGGVNNISSFGNVISGKTPTFTRVWSSATIATNSGGQLTGLVGSFADQYITVNVNGFVFDGTFIKAADQSQPRFFALYGSTSPYVADDNKFYNVITDFSSLDGKYDILTSVATPATSHSNTAALFALSSEEAAISATENVYAVKRKENGIDAGYAVGSVLSDSKASKALLTDMSAAEAAWTINRNPSKSEKPVYFKLNENGKVRPIPEGKSDGMIVGITVEIEDITKNVCVNPGDTVDLKAALGYRGDVEFVVSSGDCTIIDGTTAIVNGNATVKMINPCVEHDFRYVKGDKEHTATCSICNHKVTEACVLTDCTPNPFEWNAYTHNGTCVCGNAFSEVCDYVYTKTDDGYKYVCSCDREEVAPAPMVPGDVKVSVDGKVDGKVDLTDAIALLKNVVNENAAINVRNADVDGDNDPGIQDVRKIILFFLKDKKTIDAFEAIQQRVNEENFYNEKNIEFGNLKMDGEDGTNLRYIRTNLIPVSKGNKIVFGPVRKAQAVLGHFYDADGKAIELINVNNERLNAGENAEYTFNAEVLGKDVEVIDNGKSAVIDDLLPKVVDGLEMVSIVAPEGAAYVRLQANAKEEDQFYIRINNEFSLADYQCRTNGDANTLTNEERGQLFLTVGDSLCAAARDTLADIYPKKGWEGRININFGAQTVDSSQGGTTISTAKYYVEEDPENDTDGNDNVKYCIVNQITMHRNGLPFEYVLIEGGANDAAYAKKSSDKLAYDTKIGYYENDDPSGKQIFNPNSYHPKDFAPANTFIGGLERAIYTTIKTYGDTAAIGYLLPYPMPKSDQFEYTDNYFQFVDEVCQKWKIPYLDLYYENLNNFNTEDYTINKPLTGPDYIHADGEGYDIMQKYIDPFVQNEMRPVDQEIYLEIQQYIDIPQNLNINS